MAESTTSSMTGTKRKQGRELTPREIVAELDKYIIGQDEAKRAVAVALRNRYRRQQLSGDLKEEVIPKNILMIGPTGVGKTEIARRLSRLANAPFLKVEATKYTEVGYVGRDVESIIREITEQAVRMVQRERMDAVRDRARSMAIEQVLSMVSGRRRARPAREPLEALAGFLGGREPTESEEGQENEPDEREAMRRRLLAGELDDRMVDIEIEESKSPFVQVFSPAGMEEMGMDLQNMLGGLMPKTRKKRHVPVSEALEILTHQNAQKLIDMDQVLSEATARVEDSGIVFIDELDKIAGRERGVGPDVSREGVQRDILPIIEGCTVVTKYGPVRSDHILFIGAGAFHATKPSDLIPELQGRFPLRVELKSLSEGDFARILTEPQSSLVKQYTALLAVEGVTVEFTEDGIAEIAKIAAEVNAQTEDIGARRLHTVMERLLEEVSFHASDIAPTTVRITAAYVQERLSGLARNVDLSRYIL
jgi:ATP-dependent HslUV protease ATP-binding subunit HslU